MYSTSPAPGAAAAPRRSLPWVWTASAAGVLLLYAALLYPRMGVHAGSSDTSGYMNQARLLAAGDLAVNQRAVEDVPPETVTPYVYVPLGFRPLPHAPDQMVPTYPVGLSLLLLAGAAALGWAQGPPVVMALHLIAGVVLTYQLARRLELSTPAAVLAAAMVGSSPLYLFLGLQAMSDLPAMVWLTAAVVLAERSRQAAPCAAAAGGAFALAVLIRPTSLLLVIPVALALGLNWRRWVAFGLGGIPGAVFLGFYHHTLYGRVLTTGYGDVSSDFSRGFVWPTLQHYIAWLPWLLTPLVVLALAFPFLRVARRRHGLLLLSWIVLPLGFYSFYHYTHETWWFLRFVLPAFPPLALAAVWAGGALAAPVRWPAVVRRLTPVVLILAVGLVSFSQSRRLHALYGGRHEALYVQVTDWMQEHLPSNAVVLAMQASGALLFYTEFTFVRWDHATAADANRLLAALEENGRPLYAVLWENEAATALARWQPPAWQPVAQIDQVSVWRFPSRPPKRAGSGD